MRRSPFCGFLYFLTVLGSTFKHSFENDIKRQKVRFGVSISLLGYVKSMLNVLFYGFKSRWANFWNFEMENPRFTFFLVFRKKCQYFDLRGCNMMGEPSPEAGGTLLLAAAGGTLPGDAFC